MIVVGAVDELDERAPGLQQDRLRRRPRASTGRWRSRASRCPRSAGRGCTRSTSPSPTVTASGLLLAAALLPYPVSRRRRCSCSPARSWSRGRRPAANAGTVPAPASYAQFTVDAADAAGRRRDARRAGISAPIAVYWKIGAALPDSPACAQSSLVLANRLCGDPWYVLSRCMLGAPWSSNVMPVRLEGSGSPRCFRPTTRRPGRSVRRDVDVLACARSGSARPDRSPSN